MGLELMGLLYPNEYTARRLASSAAPLVLIVGRACSRALIVVTGNRGEFDRVPGL